MDKRKFLKQLAGGAAGLSFLGISPGILTACGPSGKSGEKGKTALNESQELFFSISLAQWSLHRTIFGGKLDPLDFPVYARKEFDVTAVEYVNQFFKEKAEDRAFLNELKKRASDSGVKSLLIMIDGEGQLADTREAERIRAVENHYKWVEAARFLGCHSIRVNAAGQGTPEELTQTAVDGLGRLATFARDYDLNVIVENHGGVSSNGAWLANVMAQVNMPNCGTLPDFGNFCIKGGHGNCEEEYDRYRGVKELMPYAKGVSAKSHDFDAEGNEIHTNYAKMLSIVKESGFNGYIGIEYEGSKLSEPEGIKATKALMERVGSALS